MKKRLSVLSFLLVTAILCSVFCIMPANGAEQEGHKMISIQVAKEKYGCINPLICFDAAQAPFTSGGPFTVTGKYAFQKTADLPQGTTNASAASVFGMSVSDTKGQWVSFSKSFSSAASLTFQGIYLWYMAGELSLTELVIRNAAGEIVYDMDKDEALTPCETNSIVRKGIWYFWMFGDYPNFTMRVTDTKKEEGLLTGSAYLLKNNLLTNVPAGSSVLQAKSNFKNSENLTITQNGKTLKESDTLAQGAKISYKNSSVSYTVGAPAEDLNGDGKIDIRDLKMAKEAAFAKTEDTATDLDGSGGGSLEDASILREMIFGRKKTSLLPTSAGPDTILSLGNPVGRLHKENGLLVMEHSASNFTLTGSFSGDVTLEVYVEGIVDPLDQIGLFVEVDGKMRYCKIDACWTYTSVVIAKDLALGKHTIKISKATDARNDRILVSAVRYQGVLEKSIPADRRIEFLGDSITAGAGVYHQTNDARNFSRYGATVSYQSYANKVADKLGADHYAVANGGWRLSYTANPLYTIQSIYPYTSPTKQTKAGEYAFDWQPQVVVINLGTNDWAQNKATYQENVKGLLTLVREKNKNARIFWAYGMMDDSHPSVGWIKEAVEAFAAKDTKTYFVHMPENTDGWVNHPNVAGQKAAADVLAAAIADVMGW